MIIVGSTETEFYVSVLQEKGSKKDYPLWAIKESADERAKYYDSDVRVQNLFHLFINIQDRLPQGNRGSLKKEIPFLIRTSMSK